MFWVAVYDLTVDPVCVASVECSLNRFCATAISVLLCVHIKSAIPLGVLGSPMLKPLVVK